MSNTVFESFFLIRDISTNKYLKFTTKTREQLRYELEVEACGSFYADSVFVTSYQQAVRIVDLEKAKEMFEWLNSINPNKYEILRIDVNGTKIS